jgi:hypothetical protein
MTDTETLVAKWLDDKRVSYDFHSTLMGGRPEYAGFIMPFILPDFNIVLRIRNQEVYENVIQTSLQRIEREQLHSIGFIVVDLHEEDIIRNTDEVMNRAINGREMSEIDTDLWYPSIGLYRGIPTIGGDAAWGRFGPQDTATVESPTVQTDAISGMIDV